MILFYVILFVSAVNAQNATTSWQQSNLIPTTYNPLSRPSTASLVVNVSIYVVQILSILETTQVYVIYSRMKLLLKAYFLDYSTGHGFQYDLARHAPQLSAKSATAVCA